MSAAPSWDTYLQGLRHLHDLVCDDDPDVDALATASTQVDQAFAHIQGHAAADVADDSSSPASQYSEEALSLVRKIQQRANVLCRQWRDTGALDDRRRRALGAYASAYTGADARYLDRRQ
ncbi:MAG: hypothetical protein EA401_07165 [Planctomycetota bacterium]|nr:MAG: hypothetical protein EA401_07165 [Planctomycetota bacterium]